VLLGMRSYGAYVDLDGFTDLYPSLMARREAVKDQIYEMREGRDINLNSSDQLGRWLYDELRLPCTHYTATGQRSTSAAALKGLARHREEPRMVLRYKDITKLMSTYVAGFFPHIDEDSRVRASFNQAIAKTGRLSCVAEDTLIEMPRNFNLNPEGVRITDVKPGDWVYAYDWKRELVLRRVQWVGQTGTRQTVIVTAVNSIGEYMTLRVTPDHLVRLYNGDWRPAGSLVHRWGDPIRNDGPRIMPMVRRGVDDGYIKFFPHSIARGNGTSGGGKVREHRWVVEQISGRKISTKADVHHLDGNRANNHPDNLEKLSIAEHRGRRHNHPWWGQQHWEPPNFNDGPNDFRVESVVPGPVEPVWDMEVEEVHNFIANGFCVHNCSAPNLQNIPSRERENTTEGDMIRRLFIAPPGYKLIVADYSQIELRILAHLTKDKKLMYAYLEGLDLHTQTASLIWGIPESEVTPKQRGIAKNSNFNLSYEGSAFRIEEMSGISRKEAEGVYEAWHNAYPQVKVWAKHVKRQCFDRGFVETLYGRKRRLPDIKSSDMSLRRFAERQAVNHGVQGLAADIAKIALVHVANALEDLDAHLTIQIHDEFIVECREDQVDIAVPRIRAAMEDVRLDGHRVLDVPLEVNIGVGDNWSEAK
jgi:hypothetical protein